jgi:hypothetical protein
METPRALLDKPRARRMFGDVAVQNTSTVVGDNEKAAEQSEGDGRNGKEVHGGDRLTVVAKEREPTLAWFCIFWRSPHPAGNGSF